MATAVRKRKKRKPRPESTPSIRAWLVRQGLAERADDGALVLTARGRELAQGLVDAHFWRG